jgi:hypothetical protein
MQLEKMKLSGGDAAKELKQEKAKRKIAETDLERERSRNAEEKDESLRKVRRLEDRYTPHTHTHAPPHTHTHQCTRTRPSTDSLTWLGPTEWRSWRRTWRTRTRS